MKKSNIIIMTLAAIGVGAFMAITHKNCPPDNPQCSSSGGAHGTGSSFGSSNKDSTTRGGFGHSSHGGS